MSAWHEMESAPKDRRIRVWVPGSIFSVGTEYHAKWDEDKYSMRPKPFWNLDAFTNRTTMSRTHQPTYWQEIGPGPYEE